jgi:hypothetical protein
MSTKKVSLTKSKSKSKKLSKSSKVLRVSTNNNGNEKYDYISKSEAKKHMTQRHKRMDKYKKNKKTKKIRKCKHKHHKHHHKHNNHNNHHHGGFMSQNSDCSVATVKEHSFNIAGSGSGRNTIPGLYIPETRAILNTPNCSNKNSTYQAMVPF